MNPEEKAAKSFIGKTLAEVKKEVELVRVIRAGDVRFVQTRDFRPERLNVTLKAEGLTFREKVVVRHDGDYRVTEVVGSMDQGIITEAHYG